MRILYYIFRVIFFLPLRILFPVKVYGKKNLPKKQTFVSVSNHTIGYDVILLWFYLRRFKRFLAKKEFQKNFILRFALWILGAIFIDRTKLDMKAMKKSIAVLKKYPLTIFPEGTRNRENEELQEVKGGAAMIAVKAGAPIVPVLIHHRHKLFRKNYIYIAPAVSLPYGPRDRFNSQAMSECTQIISQSMNESKEFLNTLVEKSKSKEKPGVA